MPNANANPNAKPAPRPPKRPNPADVAGTLGRVNQLLVKDLVRKDGQLLELIGDAAKLFNDAMDANDAEALDLMMETPAKVLLALVVALASRVATLETGRAANEAAITALTARVLALERRP